VPNPVPLVVQLFVDGAWTTYPGYSEEGWEYQIGPDIEAGLQASALGVTLQNDDLSMDPSRIQSPLYGKIGANTPSRLVINGTVVSTGEASDWDPDRTQEHVPGTGRGKSKTTLKAEGLLRRIGRWDDPLDSPMRRQIGSYASRTGNWPMEDTRDAQNLTSAVAAGVPGSYSGTVSLAGDPGAGGAAAAVELGTDGIIGGLFVASAASGWQLCWVQKLPAVPVSATPLPIMQWTDTAGRGWFWRVSSSGYQIEVLTPAGASLGVTNVGFGSGHNPSRWTRYRLKCTVSGGTVTYEPAWYEQDAASVFGTTGTFAGTSTGQPYGWNVIANAYTDGAAYGHLFAVTDTALNLTSSYEAVGTFNGYLGESTRDRFGRLLNESGFGWVIVGNSALAKRMGRQKPGTLLDLLKECAITETGLIYDDPTQLRLVLALNNSLINRTPALALSRNVDVAPPLKKKINDVRVVNDLTVTNWDGTTVRREAVAGGKSVLAPPSGVGRYRGKLDVSMRYASELADRANWELRDSTVDRPRYESVTVDLLAFPAYRATVAAMRPGDLITIAGEEPDPIPLRVLTITRRGGHVADSVTFSCRPGDLWTPGAYGNANTRIDSAWTTLGGSVTATATTLVFSTPVAVAPWSSTSSYDVMIGPEKVGIPAGGMSALTGAGPYTQTATGCVRSKNGVIRAQNAGTSIRIATQGRWTQ
jgi:hypothetical protein